MLILGGRWFQRFTHEEPGVSWVSCRVSFFSALRGSLHRFRFATGNVERNSIQTTLGLLRLIFSIPHFLRPLLLSDLCRYVMLFSYLCLFAQPLRQTIYVLIGECMYA
jgi:hypothetical protein